MAFQLTNILRDIREDAERGRIYLPAEDLRRFGVSGRRSAHRQPHRAVPAPHAVRGGTRAQPIYNESQPLLDLIHPRSRASLWALISIYSRLLDRIELSNYDVFRRRVRLPLWEKSWIVWRALVG